MSLTETSGAASSVKNSVDHCELQSCGRVYVDACTPFAKNIILTSIIAFIVTTFIGYFFIQVYHLYKNRSRLSSTTYATGTEIEVEMDNENDQAENPVAALKTEENASV